MSKELSITMNPDDLTLGDMDDFETAVGVSFSKAVRQVIVTDENGNVVRDEKGRPEKEVQLSAKAMAAMVWLSQRKKDPTFTLEDARNVKVSEINYAEETPDRGED